MSHSLGQAFGQIPAFQQTAPISPWWNPYNSRSDSTNSGEWPIFWYS